MADYKRMISYIYNYEQGIKKNNVGYARIEVRGAQCKVTVHIKAPSVKVALKVCFFFRKEHVLYNVVLGEMELQNGVGEFQVVTPANDLMGTSYTFDEMKGILLLDTKEKFFGSEWDDRPIVVEDVRFVDKNVKKMEMPMMIPEEISAEGLSEPLKSDSEPQTGSDAEPKAQSTAKAETSQVEEQKPVEQQSEEQQIEVKQPDSGVHAESKTKSKLKIGNQETVSQQEPVDSQDSFDMFSKQMQAAEFATRMLNYQKPISKNTSRTERIAGVGRQIKKNAKNKDFTDYLLEEYPKMYPFEDDEIISCVRIEPQDIGLFPMELWTLANNSFLLQGYYGYRHLIFVKACSGDKDSFLLGVPGIYRNREEFMARMFGFQMFKTVKRKDNKRGEFGYWFYNIRTLRKR